MKVQGRLMQTRFSEIHQFFLKKKKSLYTLLVDLVYILVFKFCNSLFTFKNTFESVCGRAMRSCVTWQRWRWNYCNKAGRRGNLLIPDQPVPSARLFRYSWYWSIQPDAIHLQLANARPLFQQVLLYYLYSNAHSFFNYLIPNLFVSRDSLWFKKKSFPQPKFYSTLGYGQDM